MNESTIGRRKLLKLIGATAGLSVLPRAIQSMPVQAADKNFIFCLNTATIRGHNLGFIKELETASKAGFRAVEIWIDTLTTYLEKGGTIKEAKKKLDDLGMKVENAIGFAEWIVDDKSQRQKGSEKLKKEMEILAQIGCKRIAAPPTGVVDKPGLNLNKAAKRYGKILELGDQTGVVPHLELWGFSANLKRLGEVLYVAVESGHPKARVLLDVYHLYKGGSSLETLHLMNPIAVDVLHMNDYTSNMPAATITDADRVYPGDGVAPISTILKKLKSPTRPLILSVEVFNKNYYSQDALLVAKTAFAKLKKVTEGI